MKKFFLLCVILCLSNVAYAGFLDDLASQVKAKVSIVNIQSGYTSNSGVNGNGQHHGPTKTPPIVLNYENIQHGAYGIPFGVGINEILKWCDKYNVVISQFTFEDDIRQHLINHLVPQSSNEEEYQQQVTNVIPKQTQELQNLPSPQLRNLVNKVLNGENVEPYYFGDQPNQYGKLDKYRLKADSIFLDNPSPSFVYSNQQYTLSYTFNCLSLNMENTQGTLCKDNMLLGRIYKLKVTPSVNSNDLLKDGVNAITIMFYKDDDQQIKSYESIVEFKNIMIMHNIINVLNGKYGKFVNSQMPGGKGIDFDLRPFLFPIIAPYHDYNYVGPNSTAPGSGANFWRKNIALKEGTCAYLMYFEPTIGQKILDYYSSAMKKVSDDYQGTIDAQKEKQNENF